jgi:acyl-coenzyme A thioesterase PaaI-like protein
MRKILDIYQNCSKLPVGKWLFSKLVCLKAPYFNSIKPLFVELEPGYCKIFIKKRRSVTNHLGSVHAIAMCNMSELAAGTMLEASIPNHMRWIPKGMTVSYLKIAKTDLKAECTAPVEDMGKVGDFPMTVNVTNTNGINVFQAVIMMHISEKKRKGQ